MAGPEKPRSSRFMDLTGQRFGRWKVLGLSCSYEATRPLWRCHCDCGEVRDVLRNHLRSGHSTSCGCLKSQRASEANSAQLNGRRFGRLIVIRRAGSQKTHDKRASSALWECKCDCGNTTTATSYKLTTGYKRSCGCLFLDTVTSHGKSRSRVYNIWQHMLNRCSDRATGETRQNYFSRGIRVCERWMRFEDFLADMGEPLSHQSLDRIDPNKGYEPKNCRWADTKQQLRNTRRNKVVAVNGREMLLTDAIAMLRAEARRLHPKK
jgi:hypothetical protein